MPSARRNKLGAWVQTKAVRRYGYSNSLRFVARGSRLGLRMNMELLRRSSLALFNEWRACVAPKPQEPHGRLGGNAGARWHKLQWASAVSPSRLDIMGMGSQVGVGAI